MKLPFSFSIQSAFRILLPGAFLAVAMFPFVRSIIDSITPVGFDLQISSETLLLLSSVGAGWLIGIMDMQIYMAFEGRRYWPKNVFEIMKGFETRRLERLKTTVKTCKETDRRKYLEASVDLRRFPIDDNDEYTVLFPTSLGNLLSAYEAYPKRVYGMDSPFYWPRIWLKLDKDLRGEIDNQQAMVDSAIYTAASLYLSGLFCFVYALPWVENVVWLKFLPDRGFLCVLGVISIAAGYGVYRSSLHLYAQFGETFKSVFDNFHQEVLFEDVLEDISAIANDLDISTLTRWEKYRTVWRYLHNWKIKKGDRVVTPKEFSRFHPETPEGKLSSSEERDPSYWQENQ